MPDIGKIGFVTPFKNKSQMFALMNYVFVINLFLVNYTDASSRVCRKLKHGIEDNLRYESVHDIEVTQCPPTSAPFSVYRVASGNSCSGEQQLLVCWVKDIKRFALQFEKSVQIHDVISVPGVQTRTCAIKNDTIFYNRKHNYDATFRVLLNLPETKSVPFVFRAYYSHKNNGVYYGHHRVLQYKYSGETQLHKRRKREIVTAPLFTLSSPSPLSHNEEISPFEVNFPVGQLIFESHTVWPRAFVDCPYRGLNYTSSECGNTRSCFRNGEEDCNHFGCTYFLSYNTTDNKDIDIELSAKTNGWVAVGFSSDTKMGGDEVIVCRKTRRDTVESGSYKNQYSHQDPKVITDDIVAVTLKSGKLFGKCAFLIDGLKMLSQTFHKDPLNVIYGDTLCKTFQIKDGYIYCHVTRPLSVRVSVYLDLSNDWYQLYAYGHLSSSGELEKHSVRPLVSRRISMLRKSNVLRSGSKNINILVSLVVVSVCLSIYF